VPSFFSVRLAPGVRVSASSRGLRAHVGPRGSRLHVGGGRTGVSTGAGPFTYYTPVGTKQQRSSQGYYPGPTRAQVAQSEKETQAAEIRRALDAIGSIHRAEFASPQRQVAEAKRLRRFPLVLHKFERQELAGIGIFKRSARRAARSRARALAEEHALREVAIAQRMQEEEQATYDAAWEALLANDPELVLGALARAFSDNEAPTAAVGVAGAEVSLAVLVPNPEAVIPEREPAVTPKGNLSLKKMTKRATAQWHRELVAGHLLASASEAFAAAPGLTSAAVVAFERRNGAVTPLVAARVSRGQMTPERLARSGAWALLEEIGGPVYRQKGQAGALAPIELSEQPDIAKLMAVIEDDAHR
jgi:hypothetical protein